MRKNKMNRKRIMALLLVLACLLALPAFGAAADQLDEAVNGTAAYLYKVVKSPAPGTIGGEWVVIGMARSGYEVPQSWYDSYYTAAVELVTEKAGVLHAKKYTDFSRTILGLAAIGADARDVAGYDLTAPLGDFDQTFWQGNNGPIWALIALDTVGYPVAENKAAKTQATRQMYIDEILARQLDDGGWNLTSKGGAARSDSDITGITLQALSRYQDQPAVAKATQAALDCLSGKQTAEGGFTTIITADGAQTETSESCAQVVVALCALGIDPDADPRFVKNGYSALARLLSYRAESGGFAHVKGGEVDQMATEQGFYAIVAAQRFYQGKTALYDMRDTALSIAPPAETAPGLPNKHADVKEKPVVEEGKNFPDVQNVDYQTAVEALASRKIISGMGNGLFEPDKTMTRAQFAAITTQALGLDGGVPASQRYTDVKPADWYYAAIETASRYGIITGNGDGTFNPEGTVTRQEAATMIARAAKLCGLDTDMDSGAVRDVLAQFSDYVTIPTWFRAGVAFCYSSGIWDDSGLTVNGGDPIPRHDVAQMVYDLLVLAKLI